MYGVGALANYESILLLQRHLYKLLAVPTLALDGSLLCTYFMSFHAAI